MLELAPWLAVHIFGPVAEGEELKLMRDARRGREDELAERRLVLVRRARRLGGIATCVAVTALAVWWLDFGWIGLIPGTFLGLFSAGISRGLTYPVQRVLEQRRVDELAGIGARPLPALGGASPTAIPVDETR